MKYLIILLILLYPAVSSEHSNDIRSIIIEETAKYNINPRLVWSLIRAESDGRAHIEGPRIRIKLKGKYVYTRAVGLMQVIAEYHYRGARERLFDPRENIKTGTKVLNDCLKRSKGNLVVALKNYNSGYYSNYYNWKYINKILKNIWHYNYSLYNVHKGETYDNKSYDTKGNWRIKRF